MNIGVKILNPYWDSIRFLRMVNCNINVHLLNLPVRKMTFKVPPRSRCSYRDFHLIKYVHFFLLIA